MKFNYKTLERLIPDIPPIEMVAEKITAHLFEIESYKNNVLDIKILPNRYSDAACYRGIAREIAAICKLPFKEPKMATPKPAHKNRIQPTIEVPNLCRRLMACRIEGISLGTAPTWMKDALTTYGIRSVNGIVDITNYVTIETGQPLHAFDADRMEGNELTARQAHEGETVETLDGKKITLNPSALVLSDARNALDIAGIKGGTRAEITTKTKNIVLTAGNFDGTLIYKTAKRVGITTDASIRFSHAISPVLVEQGMKRAIELIYQICEGKIGITSDAYPKPPKPFPLFFEIKRCNAITCLALTEAQCFADLKKLGFTVSGKKVTPPPERTDITRFEDLTEEITRLAGYANVPCIPPRIAISAPASAPLRALKDSVQDLLVSFGFSEILTRSFAAEGEVALENPLAPEQLFLRSSLAGGMIKALLHNAKFFNTTALFEIGSVFHKKATHEPMEEIRCIIGMISKDANEQESFRRACGAAQELHTLLGIPDWQITTENTQPTFSMGQTGIKEACVEDKLLGIIKRDEGGGAYIEFSLTKILPHIKRVKHFKEIPKYPSIVRDVSFIVEKGVKAGAVMDAAWHDTPNDLQDIRFMGLYEGKGVPAGKKSVTLRFVFQSPDRTLTDAEADSFLSYVMDAMREKLPFEIK